MKQSDALLLINAYRMGSVPTAIPEASVIRPDFFRAQEQMICALESGIPQLLMIEGQYGAGKTHALRDLQTSLSHSGFVVSTITLEPGVNLLRPDVLYYHIMHHLRIQGKPASFDDIFGLWLDNLRNAPTKQVAANEIKWVTDEMARHHEVFAYGFTQYIRASLLSDAQQADCISSWLKGDQSIAPSMQKKLGLKGSVDRLKAFDFLKAFTKLLQLIGYNGLVIAIDEMDMLTKLRSDQREKAYGTLRQIIDEQFQGAFGALGIVLSATPDVYKDAEYGIPSYSPLAQRLGLEGQGSFMKEPFISLKNTSLETLYQLSAHLVKTYFIAYGSLVMPSSKDLAHLILMDFKKLNLRFHEITWRQYIQNYLSLLDMARKNPHQKILSLPLQLQIKDDGTMFFKNHLNVIKE